MKRLSLLLAAALASAAPATAQNHAQEIARWQQHYREEFLQDARSPLKAKDTAYLRFFPVSRRWNVPVDVVPTPEAAAFDMATHAGTTKKFRSYAKLIFANPLDGNGEHDTLTAYERLRAPGADSLVFIPFNDGTNGEKTYGGGRYMDILKRELDKPGFRLDFNKAYNPWCVFAGGYSCPIPPTENRIDWPVNAGEMLPEERIRAKE